MRIFLAALSPKMNLISHFCTWYDFKYTNLWGPMRAKQGQRKLVCRSHRWKQSLLYFSIWKAWSQEFCLRRSQWMRSCISIFYKRIRCVWPQLWANNSWLFHQENAPMHSAFKIRDFFAKNQVNVLDHPPYSPDLTPCDFFLFHKIKNTLKGHNFKSVEDIQKKSTSALKGIKEEEFSACFE